jgi:hypothetical protein
MTAEPEPMTHEDALLDEALEDTFPASDPVSMAQREPRAEDDAA